MHNAKSLSGYFRYKEVGYVKPGERATYFMFLSTRYIVCSEKGFSVVYVSKKKNYASKNFSITLNLPVNRI